MKNLLRKLFSPILKPFESGTAPYSYKPANRAILIILGSLFTGLAFAVSIFAPDDDMSFLFPVIVFGGGGVLSLIIGFLGTDRAVSKIWGQKK